MTQYNVHKVSVCIPTYNYGRFIADAIESVLAQTFSDYELIISDNCSDDNTRHIVEKYTISDSRIRYYCNEQNIGMVGNWNRCLELAQGEYVKILCADDLLEPICLEESVNALECYTNAVLVSGARLLVDTHLKPVAKHSFGDSLQVVLGTDVIQRCLVEGNLIGEPTSVLFRRALAVRGFDTAYQQITDMEMWFHILENGYFAFVPDVICRYRQHEDQETQTNRKSLSIVEDQFTLYGGYLEKPYVKYGFLEREEILFNVAFHAWSQRILGVDLKSVIRCIARHFGLMKFFVLLALKTLKRRFSAS
ncbi:glycosyltransferase family 2 protein [Geomobilimonas luticola]|uniref:Glycosyltransferase n=1 Tax=Geomobilimonas luticola TaxID=1114878 RepID=A0ABS5SEL4_9BACT|nr:glycosyltransferase [Geomobilimonas luticola]MBT0653788.1 glycosyltransferase [Geomobilimonas luticola]